MDTTKIATDAVLYVLANGFTTMSVEHIKGLIGPGPIAPVAPVAPPAPAAPAAPAPAPVEAPVVEAPATPEAPEAAK